MKKTITLILVMILLQNLIVAQISIQSEKFVKDFITGKKINVREYITATPETIRNKSLVVNTNSSVELVWEATEDAAIFEMVVISDETYHCIVNRELNYHGWGYYNEISSTPVWEYFTDDFERVPCDITSDGTYMAGGAGNTVCRFTPSSGTPDGTYSLDNSDDEIWDLSISANGKTVYFSSGSPCYISSVNLETLTENWSYALPSGGWTQAMTLSANGERLVVIQYSWVIVYSNTGDVIFQSGITAGSQIIPAISDDGNIFVTGDLEGNAIVYEYNTTTETYDVKWQYLFEPEAYYDWASSVAVSGDGSTIALGSLHFDGVQNSGELAVFNTQSNVPIWIYESIHEEVSAIDISADGSIITAISDGPLYDDDEDFWIFNKDSNVPFFEYNCQGSPIDIDISDDGTKCIVGGKAVHNSVTGNGGKLYYFDISRPPSVSGTVTDANTNEPIEGVVITLGTSYSDTTNSSGFYNVEQVDTGNYTLTCELTGYETFVIEIEVEGTETIDIELQNLFLPPTDLQYTITAPDVILQWEAPVTGAVVSGYKVYRNSSFLAETDNETYTDSVVAGTYAYYVTAMYSDNESVPSNEVVVEVTDIRDQIALQKNVSVTNYPNPFDSETTISYSIPVSSNVIIEIYDIQGKKIKTLVNEYQLSGNHLVNWNGKDNSEQAVSNGVYFCRIRTGKFFTSKEMILRK